MTQTKKDPLPLSYLNVRKIVGVMGMLFPVIVFLGNVILFDTELLSSISANYHSRFGWFFVIVLVAIGIFMFTHQYYEADTKWEKRLAIAAGIFAIMVAIFPTASEELPIVHRPLFEIGGIELDFLTDEVIAMIHLGSAALLFFIIGVFIFHFIPKKEEDLKDNEANERRKWYKGLGGLIFLMIVIMALDAILGFIGSTFPNTNVVSLKEFFKFPNLVYWGELLALWFFGIAWAISGEVFWKTAAPLKNRDRFNKLQNRREKGYKDGMGWIAAAVALIFTMLLYSANTVPFNLFDEEKKDDAQKVATADIDTVLNEEGEEPEAMIQVLNPDDLNEQCYIFEPEDDKEEKDYAPCKLQANSYLVPTHLVVANISDEDVELTIQVSYSEPCIEEEDCLLVNHNSVEQFNTGETNGHEKGNIVPGQSFNTLVLEFPAREVSGEIFINGGNSVTALPFEIITQETYLDSLPPQLVRGYSADNAKNILNNILFVLTTTVFFFILNFQILPLFWPLIRRHFRVDLGENKDGKISELWTMFSDVANEVIPTAPAFSINPNAETSITSPEIMTKESKYLQAFFDLISWIFPRFGYSLQMEKHYSPKRREGISLAIRKNATKEPIAEKIFWAESFRIEIPADEKEKPAGKYKEDLCVYRLLMIPVYYWLAQKVDEMNGFELPEATWQARTFYSLGHRIWHSNTNESIEYHSLSISRNPEFWPAHASLGRLWSEKSQEKEVEEETKKQYLKFAIKHLTTAINRLRKEHKLREVYFAAFYNLIVALSYYQKLDSNLDNEKVMNACNRLKEEARCSLALCNRTPSMEFNYDELETIVDKLEYENEEVIKYPDEDLKETDVKILKSHRFSAWLIYFIPSLEFVRLILEAKNVINGATDNYDGFETFDSWLKNQFDKNFNVPYLNPPINLDTIPENIESLIEPDKSDMPEIGYHFADYHFRTQYNTACFYSMIAPLMTDKGGKDYIDLALDHLELSIGKSSTMKGYATKDSDLYSVRKGDPERFEQVIDRKGGSKKHDRIVYQLSDGRWANKRITAKRPTSWHPTQKEAITEARRLLIKHGGGILKIMGEDGKLRDELTIGGGE